AKAAKRMRMAFSRSRKALGNIVLFQGDQYQFNEKYQIDVDAVEFKKLIEQARPLSWYQFQKENLLKKALSLYAGVFLSKIERTWAEQTRAELAILYVGLLVDLGMCAEKRGSIDEAMLYFSRALTLDQFNEDIHRKYLRMLIRAGRFDSVVQHWQALCDLYHDELGISPSPETAQILDRIR
ncbi:MAG: bacterial transcriptional activator domain-containing protein, partial [Chloroflexota bacterium]